MNDKIRQLAEQASHQSPDGYPVTIPYSKDFAEKFAQLIVNECCEQLLKEDIRYGGYGYNQYGLHNKLREHFGVKK